MSEKTKFSKREWIHLIITLSIVQAAIWFVSFVYANNSSALGYISFAGTIISIILAVLAIGYTYGESQQQKNSSSTLGNQIESLIKIKDKLEIQAEALEDIKSVKNHIIDLSEKLDSSFKETNSNIGLFRDLFSERNIEEIDKTENITDIENIDREYLLKKIIGEKPSKYTKIIFIVSLLYFEQREQYKGKGFSALRMFFEDNDIVVVDDETYNLIFGGVNQLALILNRCGFFKAKSDFVEQLIQDQFNSFVNDDQIELSSVLKNMGSEILEFAKESKYYKKS
ncbi:hypothetical protein [Acinetobacter guillouiae]|uniref:hypothetical protein n=1 Tax=Acinetobacter guillouiae TaxID=106649 RepID=UPI002E21C10C